MDYHAPANQAFSGTITGTNFSLPIVVWFCSSSGSCQQLAASQVTLNSATSLSVTGVTLASGSWQVYVQTNGGPSARSRRSRSAPTGAPTVTGYTWTTTPTANQPFSGTISGTNSSSPIVIWLCPSSGSCLQLAASQVTLYSATSVSVTNVALAPPDRGKSTCKPTAGLGALDVIYVVQSGGDRRRADGHRLLLERPRRRPISRSAGRSRGQGSPSPIVVWFCPSSGSCLQLAASQVTLYSATSIGVSNVILATAGSWQVYVQTNGGPSGRSTPFRWFSRDHFSLRDRRRADGHQLFLVHHAGSQSALQRDDHGDGLLLAHRGVVLPQFGQLPATGVLAGDAQ